MKFMHIADLHIGKKVNEYSMIEDQKYILNQIVSVALSKNIETLLIAGDVYDKPVPPAEAVQVFDEFLTNLSFNNINICIISGNHDSAERLSFGSNILKKENIFIAPVYNGVVERVMLEDNFGEINVYMLPYVKPVHVRHFFEKEEIGDYNKAVEAALSQMEIDRNQRNILLCHQFVTGALCCDSEELSVGGLDSVSAENFSVFDYVALGHIHSPQKIGKETVRYSGTPLKYSFSEIKNKNSVVVFDMGEKGDINIELVPLVPLRELREIKGTYMEITDRKYYKDSDREDYLHVILTDEYEIPEAIGKLRSVYPNIMRLDYSNHRTSNTNSIDYDDLEVIKSPLELFDELYTIQNNQNMSAEQKKTIAELIEKVWV